MLTLLHFADAHIDMANYGRHDPQTGLPLRVMDFLKSLDTIVETAISEKVDIVLFAGDAYKDRSPAPTFQREWGKRIMRLSRAGVPTLLLVGNHDLSPSIGRASAIEEYNTLEVPHVRVIDRPAFFAPDELEGLPLQIAALPWVARSALIASLGLDTAEQAYEAMEDRLTNLVHHWLDTKADPALPTVLLAHASVQGAIYGGERAVMLGNDLVLSASLVKDPRLDYVALGHIHKPQNLNKDAHPPVIYPGSIERVDFGEAEDKKYFIIAQLERGRTHVEWRELSGIRPFVNRFVRLDSENNVNDRLRAALPPPARLREAIVRLTVEYPREWETQIDDAALHAHCAEAFEFQLVKRPQMETRIRLPGDQAIGSLTPLELLDLYWRTVHMEIADSQALNKLAKEIIEE